MFIRFVSGEIDTNSHVSAGVFCAAFDLIDEARLSGPDRTELVELMHWFDRHLKGPFEHRLKSRRSAERSICWFKANAHDYVKQAWKMTRILERNNVLVWVIKSRRAGYIIYEDEAQIVAEPFADVRRVL